MRRADRPKDFGALFLPWGLQNASICPNSNMARICEEVPPNMLLLPWMQFKNVELDYWIIRPLLIPISYRWCIKKHSDLPTRPSGYLFTKITKCFERLKPTKLVTVNVLINNMMITLFQRHSAICSLIFKKHLKLYFTTICSYKYYKNLLEK